MDCVVNVRKAAGPTSHDVVNQVRRIFHQKRVGHAGTLDPMATGVLVVCLGKATRIVEYLVGGAKEYRARMILGMTTDTQDSTGETLTQRDASGVTFDALCEAAAGFVGEIEQVPPMVSAIKHQGKPLYKLAREGKTIERAARKVTIHGIEIAGFMPGERAEAELVVRCSSGTYIRTLCADIGETLGCGASMSALERTRVGRFSIEDSVTVEQLMDAESSGTLDGMVTGIDEAISDMPAVVLGEDDIGRVMHGIAVGHDATASEGAVMRMVAADGRLVAIGTVSGAVVRPHKVIEVTDR